MFAVLSSFILQPNILCAEKTAKIDKGNKEYIGILKQIMNLKDTIRIRIIYRELPTCFCGYLSTASLTTGIKDNKDTITAISFCDQDSLLKIADTVLLVPCDSNKFNPDIIGNNNTAINYIKHYKTYYCQILKNNKSKLK